MGRLSKREAKNRKIGAAVSKMTEEAINKLKYVFSIDGTVQEACSHAEIAIQTYYNWAKKNPKLLEQFERLRENPVLKARTTMNEGLSQPEHARWYLERKRHKEFGSRQSVEHDMSQDVRDLIEKANKLLE